MSDLLIGLSVPLPCLALLLGMAGYETWLLGSRPNRSSRGFGRAVLRSAGTQLPAVVVGLPGALLAAGGILTLRSRLAPT